MGITGLLPFLEKSSKKTNISDFAGKTVAIDTYCWLHKGAFSCADKLVMGQETDAYVKYCMKFVSMLLSHNIKPILVFDGRHLPAKAETEVKRRENRQANRKRAAELIKLGQIAEGKNLLRRSLDVSHKMALEVIKQCQAHNVDCIVAPYEADAQLAYLNISGIADVVITEDSDLTLFGCKKIFFKMDLYGHGVLVEQERLHLAMGLKPANFHMDKFRHMCILSGCDYLASLPGIGLAKACKFIVKNTDDNIYNALLRLSSSLNMKSLVVTKEYRDSFIRALITFKHQLVYCPLQRKQARLYPPTTEVTEDQLKYAGTEINEKLAWQLALGNCDPFTYEKIHDFDPDNIPPRRSNAWSEIAVAKHASIWSKVYAKIIEKKNSPMNENQLPAKPIASTKGKFAVMKTEKMKNEITPKKRTFEECEMSVDDIVQIYMQEEKATKEAAPTKIKTNYCSSDDEKQSPIIVRRSNPFRKTNGENETSPSLVHKIRKRLPIKSRLRPTVIDNSAIACSKFFAPEPKIEDKKEEKKIEMIEEAMNIAESMDVNIDEEDYKENMNLDTPRVIIPESESFDEMEFEIDVKENNHKDSGYRSLSVEKDLNISTMSCDDPISEKEPLHFIDNNPVQNKNDKNLRINKNLVNVEREKIQTVNDDDDVEFTITRKVFSEYRSSMFEYKTPDKKLKRDSNNTSLSQGSQSLSQSSQGSSSSSTSRRGIKSTKKNAIIHGQQSLLNMFGFQKKDVLKH